MFFNNCFSSFVKITVVFVRKLSGVRFVYYRYIFTQVIGSMLFNNFFPSLVIVIMVFVRKLSAMRFIYYISCSSSSKMKP